MTKTLTTRTLPNFLNERGIGFNSMFDMFDEALGHVGNTSYPPYNVIQMDENNFAIEVALAGFSDADVSITKDGNKLTIDGEKKTQESDAKAEMYLHRGISSRAFTREFLLAEHVEVTGATMKDGVLLVQLQRELPDSEKPRTIAINS